MVFTLTLSNTNLQQAIEMSVYPWAFALGLSGLVLLIDHFKLKNVRGKQKFYQILIFLIVPYTMVTSCLWLYYFTIVLCIPFFLFQLFLTWKFHRVNSLSKMNRLFKILAFLTLINTLSSAWFFGII